MKILFPVAVSLCLVGAVAFAMEPVLGFQDYKFGMTFDDINDELALTEIETNDKNYHSFAAKETFEILGDAYEGSFSFVENMLVNVNLARMGYSANIVECESDFDEAFSAIQARYGNPDRPADKDDIRLMKAEWTAVDGSKVFLGGNGFDVINNCSIVVTYKAGKTGSTF